MNKAVFLDRDGTVIRDMVYLNDPNQIFFLNDSEVALSRLYDAGFMLFLVTNQSGVARGIVKLENLHRINEIVMDHFKKNGAPIQEAYYCPHPVDGNCQCRKPRPGMILDAARKFEVDLKKSWMVGDRLSDVEAGIAAGCQSILLSEDSQVPLLPGSFVTKDLLEASSLILKQSSPLIAK